LYQRDNGCPHDRQQSQKRRKKMLHGTETGVGNTLSIRGASEAIDSANITMGNNSGRARTPPFRKCSRSVFS
jgi:hypothetical protein